METLIVKIKRQNKAAFTKELLKSFDFLEVTTESENKRSSPVSTKRKAALLKGFKELKLVETGKLKAKSATDLLKELNNGKN
ncbi:MAG: hypothetical protein JNM14_02105 [Ferruginibacter sp.]|nr:hypothetical protein [Ferruginibacter sp.]